MEVVNQLLGPLDCESRYDNPASPFCRVFDNLAKPLFSVKVSLMEPVAVCAFDYQVIRIRYCVRVPDYGFVFSSQVAGKREFYVLSGRVLNVKICYRRTKNMACFVEHQFCASCKKDRPFIGNCHKLVTGLNDIVFIIDYFTVKSGTCLFRFLS